MLQNHKFALILACAWIGLAGCQPGLTPVAQPDPIILTLQMTPVLDRLRPDMHACAVEETLGLAITSLPATALDPLDAGLALRWSEPAENELYAAVLAQEALVFIVHPGNPLKNLTAGQLSDLYTGRLGTWPGSSGAEVHAWAYPPGDDVQQVFESALLGSLAGKSGLAEQPGLGGQDLPVFLAPDPAAMLSAIAQDEQALGFLPAGWLTGQVRAIEVSGLSQDLLNQPILALSPAEPQPPARGWLLCLQSRLARSSQ